jgi:hypothetical protein
LADDLERRVERLEDADVEFTKRFDENDHQHQGIKKQVSENTEHLIEIKITLANREKYIQGIKHGVSGLWATIVTAAIAVWVVVEKIFSK